LGAAQRTAYGETRTVVGEAVNVVSLDAFGLIRATVILRGDAIALNAKRAVRALFDAPRIVFGKTGRWFNINVGPKTSVVLDAPYCDANVRIGVGGRSGSRFVFRRCGADDVEANEFRALLSKKPWSRRRTLTALLAITAASTDGAVVRRSLRLLGGAISLCSILVAALIAFSGGGIEAGDPSVDQSKKILQ